MLDIHGVFLYTDYIMATKKDYIAIATILNKYSDAIMGHILTNNIAIIGMLIKLALQGDKYDYFTNSSIKIIRRFW